MAETPTFPFPSDQLDPPVEYAVRRRECPMGRVRIASGHDVVLLVTHKDIAAAMNDTRLSHNVTGPGSPRVIVEDNAFDNPNSINNMDGEEHRRVRRIVASAFSARHIQSWRIEIEQVAEQLLDDIERAGAPSDIMNDFCVPFPIRIICRLLGVPEEDTGRFRDWSNAVTSAARLAPADRMRSITEFALYTKDLLARRRAEPGNALIDHLIAARDGEDRLSEWELLTLVIGLIAAGNETVSNSLGRYLFTLLGEERDVWDELLVDPARIPAAVEELLRHTILGTTTTLRIAQEDVELPSGLVRAGDTVALTLVAALRDETVFPEPNRVRLDRPKTPLLAFGGGPHRCLGANLAVLELQIALEALGRRFAGMRVITPSEEVRFFEGEFLSSLVSLDVTW